MAMMGLFVVVALLLLLLPDVLAKRAILAIGYAVEPLSRAKQKLAEI